MLNKTKLRTMYFIILVAIFMLIPDTLIGWLPGDNWEYGLGIISLSIIVITFNQRGKYVKFIDEFFMWLFAFGISLIIGDFGNFVAII